MERTSRVAWRRGVALALATWLLVLPTFLVPAVDLRGGVALAAYWVSEVGGPFGLPALAALLVAMVVTRPTLAAGSRVREAAVLLLVLAVFLGGGAWLNEHVIKPGFAVPRPNILELAASGVLGLSPEGFYGLGDKLARTAYLEGQLPAALAAVPMAPDVQAHWAVETGYSFPSGHSFASMFFATFALGLALGALSGWRRGLALLLVPLALAVCYARPLLRVHSPTDVSVGSAQGLVLALIALAIFDLACGRVQDGEPDPTLPPRA